MDRDRYGQRQIHYTGYAELVPRDDAVMDARRGASSRSASSIRGNEMEEDRYARRQVHHSGFIQHLSEYGADVDARGSARSHPASTVSRGYEMEEDRYGRRQVHHSGFIQHQSDAPYGLGDRNRGAVDRYESESSYGDAPYGRGDRNRGAVDRYESESSFGGGINYRSNVQLSPCIVEFDGSSKGNPGQAGAGAVLRAADGSMVVRLREGVGIATSNVAEYRGAILGLKYALQLGFKHIRIQGDSQLVCMQVQGLWRTTTQNMYELCMEVKELKDRFLSFQILHVGRDYNTEADAQANLAVHLRNGEIEVERV